MFRVQKPFHRNWDNRLALSPLAVIILALSFLVSPLNSQPVDAGNSDHRTKRIGVQKSGGHKMVRVSNRKATSHFRMSTKRHASGNRKLAKKQRSNTRTYVKRRSILDNGRQGYNGRQANQMHRIGGKRRTGNQQMRAPRNTQVRSTGISSRQLYHRQARGQSRSYGVRRYDGHSYNKNRIYSSRLSGDGVLSDGVNRSGVKYVNRRNLRANRFNNRRSGFYEVAGAGRTKIIKRRLQSNNTSTKRAASGFSNSGLIVIGVSNSSSMQEVAGSDRGASSANCEYGTYCTIDLGGPKIITYNDTADILDGELVDEDLTDEEYLQKYGTK